MNFIVYISCLMQIREVGVKKSKKIADVINVSP